MVKSHRDKVGKEMYKNGLKRVFDFCCALLALIVLSPFLLIFMILGAVFMGGNPFFTQPRPGKDEKVFKLIKFRTMSNAKDKNGIGFGMWMLLRVLSKMLTENWRKI